MAADAENPGAEFKETNDQKWKSAANAEYQKAVSTITSLATASLALPIVFMRSIIGLGEHDSLQPHLTWIVYVAWILLGIAVAAGLVFSWASSKLVKAIYQHGEKARQSEKRWEPVRDTTVPVMIGTFVVGLIFLLVFFVQYDPASGKP